MELAARTGTGRQTPHDGGLIWTVWFSSSAFWSILLWCLWERTSEVGFKSCFIFTIRPRGRRRGIRRTTTKTSLIYNCPLLCSSCRHGMLSSVRQCVIKAVNRLWLVHFVPTGVRCKCSVEEKLNSGAMSRQTGTYVDLKVLSWWKGNEKQA